MNKLVLNENPTLADIQRYVNELEEARGFSKEAVAEKCLLLAEEVGELCKVIRKHHTSMAVDVGKDYDFDAAGEIADILVVLSAVANRLGIDMEQAFRNKEEQNKQRTWK